MLLVVGICIAALPARPDENSDLNAGDGSSKPRATLQAASTAFATLNEPFIFRFSGTGGEMTYAASGLPAGLRLDSSAGIISGTATTSGVFPVILKASNGSSAATVPPVLTVGSAPTITSPSFVRALAGLPFSYQITTTNHPTSFGPFPLYAPYGLTYDWTKGFISGVPQGVSHLNGTISAANGGGTGTAPLEIDVEHDLASTLLTQFFCRDLTGPSG